MKKLRKLIQSGELQKNSKLKKLYEEYTNAQSQLDDSQSNYLGSKGKYKELEDNPETSQSDLEIAYMERMMAKHLRNAAEFRFLLAETKLGDAIKSKKKKGNKKKSDSKGSAKTEKSKAKKETKKPADEGAAAAPTTKATVTVDPFVVVKKEAKEAEPKRKAGRPAGAKNKKNNSEPVVKTARKKAGRPPGAKNKKTIERVVDGDDLRKIEGVGPAAEKNLIKAGFDTYKKIASATPEDLYNKLTAISQRMAVLALDSFPQQAKLAAAGKWEELETLQAGLARGRTGDSIHKRMMAANPPVPKVKKSPGRPKKVVKERVVDGDDLRKIEGVGPAAEKNLIKAGFDTFKKIASATPEDLYKKLTAISQRMAVLALDSFPQQAKLAAAGKWEELEALQEGLARGRTGDSVHKKLMAAKPAEPKFKKSAGRPKKEVVERVVDGDDLRKLEGVGPAAEKNLIAAGFDTYEKIANATEQELHDKLTAISRRMAVLALHSFPKQAKLAAAGKWKELEKYQGTLNRGR